MRHKILNFYKLFLQKDCELAHFSNILEYQKLDSNLFKLEKELKDNSNRKTAEQMAENIKNAQAR